MNDPRLTNERESARYLIAQRDRRIQELEEALRFYADLNNWYEDSHEGDSWEGVWWRGVHYGRGWQLARAALFPSKEDSEAGE